MPLKSLSKVSVGASRFSRLPNGFKRSSKLTQTMPIDGDNVASIRVVIGTTAVGTGVFNRSATTGVTIGVSASGQQTDQQHYGTATVGVVISSTASASVTSTHSGTATASIVITTTAAGETGAIHSGTANIGVTISASSSGTVVSPVEGTANIGVTISATASGTASQTHAGVASCQVNLSVSASAFNTSTTVPDETSNGNNMSLYADGSGTKYAYSTDAVIGTRSVEFEGSATIDGTGGYGIIDNTFQSVFRSSFSVSAWVKLDDGDANYNWILGNYPSGGGGDVNYVALYFMGGDPRFYYRAGSVGKLAVDFDYDLANGQSGWIHLVGTYNATDDNMYLYVNGTEVASDTTSTDPTQYTSSVNLRVNKYEDQNANYIYTGKKIDDISIWSKALSSTEVSNMYNSGNGTNLSGSSDLEGWWKMGDHSVVPVTHSGVATVSVDVTASASGETFTTHSGTATVSVVVTASASGNAFTAHSGTASCQVNLSASASGTASTPVLDNDYAVSCDGTDDYIDLNSNFSSVFNSDFSVAFWINLPEGQPSGSGFGTGSNPNIFGLSNSGNAHRFFGLIGLSGASDAGKLRVYYKAGGTQVHARSASAFFSSGATGWVHVVVTVEEGSNGIKMYKNGSAVSVDEADNSMSSVTMSNFAGNVDMTFGASNRSGTPNYETDADFDEIAIFNTALSASQVSTIYNNASVYNLDGHSNLEGWWRFEEGSGTSVADSSSNSNTATLVNGPTFSTNAPIVYANDYSLDFDGTNDYLSTSLVTNSYDLKNGFSASLWVKLDDVSTTQDFFGRYGASTGRFYFGITGSNVRAAIGTSFDTSTLSHGMSTGTWYHVAYTFSGGSSGTFTYYLNGSSVGTISFTWTSDSGSYEPMHIGGLKNGSNLHQNPTNGKLDEFALYNSALSASDITAIYNSGAPVNQGLDSNLVAYWRMEENTGTTVADSSSNSNTATLNNGPTFSTDTP